MPTIDPTSTERASGDIDTSYGLDGYQRINPDNAEFYQAFGLSLTNNDHALIAGAMQVTLPSHIRVQFVLMCRDKNGALVRDFDKQGSVTGSFKNDEPMWGSYGTKTFVTRDGSLLLFGETHNHANMWMPSLASFHGDGSLDINYGENGTYVLPSPLPGESGSHGKSVVNAAIQSTGSIVTLYQYVHETNFWGGLLSRILPDGVLDNTFNGGQGYAETLTLGGEIFSPSALALQPSDRILVAGNTEDNRGIKCGMIQRYDKHGRRTKFAGNGEHRVQGYHYAHLVSVDSAILICGSVPEGALLYKLDSDGMPHADFDERPVITAEVTAWCKVLAQGERIYAIGIINEGFSSEAVLACFTSMGKPVDSFGPSGNGRVLLAFGGQNNQPIDLAIDSQNRVLVLGSAKGSIGAESFLIACFFA